MLPSLGKTYNRQDSLSNNQSSVKASQQVKIYDPPFQNSNYEQEQTKSFVYSSKKIKTAKDFKRRSQSKNQNKRSGGQIIKGGIGGYSGGYSVERQRVYQSTVNHASSMPQPKGPIYIKQQAYQGSNKSLTQQIKLIQRKIRQCQKKIDLQKKKAQMELLAQTGDNSGDYDFQKVIKHQMQIQEAQRGRKNFQIQEKGFDYLTNPGKPGQQEVVQQPQRQNPKNDQPKPYNINQGIQKLQRHYQNNLKRKFERREMFPHQPCKRKTPKLSITEKNAMKKSGKASTDQQHMFRVMTKEITPQEIYPTIPNFAVVKDNLSKNIVAYLGDYKPFVQKTRQNREFKLTKQEQLTIENRKKDMIKQDENNEKDEDKDNNNSMEIILKNDVDAIDLII